MAKDMKATEKTEIPIRRMVAAEQKSFLELMACISQLASLEGELARRVALIPSGVRLLHSGRGMLTRLSLDIMRSMTNEQLIHLRRQLPGLRILVGTTAQMPRNADREHGRWLSFEELDVVANAIRECCRTCTIDDPQAQRQCPYAKLLDVLPTDKPDEHAPGCGFFTIWGC